MFVGHKSEDGRVQPLREHLEHVSTLAGEFAHPFQAEACAARVGLLHDAGKYSAAGQRRMLDPVHTAKVDHATAGAKIALERYKDAYGASVIAGHHGGMLDVGSKRFASQGDGTLYGRCQKELTGALDASAYWTENTIPEERDCYPIWLKRDRNAFIDQFYTRMLFSCLVDADFLDTEAFMHADVPLRGGYATLHDLLEKLTAYVAPWLTNPSDGINAKRSEILKDCLSAAERRPGLYSLTVPTGGGKTISSLAFALKHAVQHGMRRVIYVIPYTSIIEQNAAVFREILGDAQVIEHHAGVVANAEEDQENDAMRRKMLATENWDAPVIVTTAVQFFESLFSNKPSQCRKLHNMANSVIIFDEAQMLPLPLLKPCVQAIAELVWHYHVTAVLCTATQPSLNDLIHAYAPGLCMDEICRDVSGLQAFFRRVRFTDRGALALPEVAQCLSGKRQVLCIVNTRRSAQRLFQMLPAEGSYHLSTWMTPRHRAAVLAEVRRRLAEGEPCRVVSTSLLEAGVDVDFPTVWRERAGLDSMLQAAGRCNREGKRDAQQSEVVIFDLPDALPQTMQPHVAAAKQALAAGTLPDDSTTIQAYFHQLYRMRGEQSLDAKGILAMCGKCQFRQIAQAFHMIDSDTCTVYVPDEANADDIHWLRQGAYSRALMRRLGRSAVNVAQWDWQRLREAGQIEVLDENSAILTNAGAYHAQYGLVMEGEIGAALFL